MFVRLYTIVNWDYGTEIVEVNQNLFYTNINLIKNIYTSTAKDSTGNVYHWVDICYDNEKYLIDEADYKKLIGK